MLYVNHHTICRINQKHRFLRWLANGVFQNNDLCWQAFPFPPPPSPLLHFLFHNSFPPPPSLHFSLVTISCAAKLSKSRSSVFLCSENPQKRLLRRLSLNNLFIHHLLAYTWPGESCADLILRRTTAFRYEEFLLVLEVPARFHPQTAG